MNELNLTAQLNQPEPNFTEAAEPRDAEEIWDSVVSKAAEHLKQTHSASHWADWYTLEIVAEKIAHTQVFVHRQEGQIAGVYSLSDQLPNYFHEDESLQYQPKPSTVTLGMLGVNPDIQARGIGTALLKDAETRARNQGFEYMVFDTNAAVAHIVNFYLKQGYQRVDELYDEGDTYFIFEKQL